MASVPASFDKRPVVTASVPVPELVIVPWSFRIAAGVRLKSSALVWIEPNVLSSVPETWNVVAAVPVCVMLPRLTRSNAESAS
ncbi:hypothetical protein AWB83_02812 [Caballeronia ptereochthonis]|uniref:Uncharacterized protein n=1 Tax=Caballeronia ptereochthonis TaxID=1777144 RepID=A0A158B5T3_9BURK|nr:hypothetical protein AWB83_02812 [Caballeronia ptereochthonis]